MATADFVPASAFVPAELPEAANADAIAARFQLTPAEAERVLLLALTELDRATVSAWRTVPVPTWEDWIIRTCGTVIAAKKTPTTSSSGASQGTRADQGSSRPAGPRAYLAGIQNELVQYVGLGFA